MLLMFTFQVWKCVECVDIFTIDLTKHIFLVNVNVKRDLVCYVYVLQTLRAQIVRCIDGDMASTHVTVRSVLVTFTFTDGILISGHAKSDR